jgi:hypothetical protein
MTAPYSNTTAVPEIRLRCQEPKQVVKPDRGVLSLGQHGMLLSLKINAKFLLQA